MHTCDAHMLGFDQEAEYGSVPGLYCIVTKDVKQNLYFADLLPAWHHIATELTGVPENSLAFELTSSSASSRSFLSAFLQILLINHLFNGQGTMELHNPFWKSNINLLEDKT